MTNTRNTVLYTGVTSDLNKRVHEHKTKKYKGFTGRYNVCKLVYYEKYRYVYDAIAREKQIKAGSRKKKLTLVNSANSNWDDITKCG